MGPGVLKVYRTFQNISLLFPTIFAIALCSADFSLFTTKNGSDISFKISSTRTPSRDASSSPLAVCIIMLCLWRGFDVWKARA